MHTTSQATMAWQQAARALHSRVGPFPQLRHIRYSTVSSTFARSPARRPVLPPYARSRPTTIGAAVQQLGRLHQSPIKALRALGALAALSGGV